MLSVVSKYVKNALRVSTPTHKDTHAHTHILSNVVVIYSYYISIYTSNLIIYSYHISIYYIST